MEITFLVLFIISILVLVLGIVLLILERVTMLDIGEYTFFLPLMFGAIFSGAFGLLYFSTIKTYEKCIANEIVSIEKDNTTSGVFILGSGNIESKTYYFYYVRVNENTYKLDKVDASRTYVIEDDMKTPSVYEVKECGELFSDYYICVPEGTIVKEFHL